MEKRKTNRIGLCGTMCVGKTSLVNALKELDQFKDYKFATERSQYLMSLGIPLNTDSTLKGQTVFLAERCSELMYENIITDRTILDVMAFTLNANSIAYQDKEAFERYASNFVREYDYIFYISPEGIPVEENGVRETDEHYRSIIDHTIVSLVKKHGHKAGKVEKISGSTDERIQQILTIMEL
jgi:GTPase SAR1 family protein